MIHTAVRAGSLVDRSRKIGPKTEKDSPARRSPIVERNVENCKLTPNTVTTPVVGFTCVRNALKASSEIAKFSHDPSKPSALSSSETLSQCGGFSLARNWPRMCRGVPARSTPPILSEVLTHPDWTSSRFSKRRIHSRETSPGGSDSTRYNLSVLESKIDSIGMSLSAYFFGVGHVMVIS
jgi:hypothetical protein